MSTPIYIIVGQAGSGKDAVADCFVESGAVKVALADPMKRFAKNVFKFSDKQLWGPSELRNAVIPESASEIFWEEVAWAFETHKNEWLDDIFGGDATFRANAGGINNYAHGHLQGWFETLPRNNFSVRTALQTLGTEFGRALDKNIWVDYTLNIARKLLGGDYDYDRTLGLLPKTGHINHLVVISDGRFRNEILAVKAIGGKAIRVVRPDEENQSQVGIASHASEQEQKGILNHWFDYKIVNNKDYGISALTREVHKIFRAEQPIVFWTDGRPDVDDD